MSFRMHQTPVVTVESNPAPTNSALISNSAPVKPASIPLLARAPSISSQVIQEQVNRLQEQLNQLKVKEQRKLAEKNSVQPVNIKITPASLSVPSAHTPAQNEVVLLSFCHSPRK